MWERRKNIEKKTEKAGEREKLASENPSPTKEKSLKNRSLVNEKGKYSKNSTKSKRKGERESLDR